MVAPAIRPATATVARQADDFDGDARRRWVDDEAWFVDRHHAPMPREPDATGRLASPAREVVSAGAQALARRGLACASRACDLLDVAHRSSEPDPSSLLAEALALPLAERSHLAAALLASLGAPPGLPSLEQPGMVEELDRVADEHDADPSRARPWSEVRAEMLALARKR